MSDFILQKVLSKIFVTNYNRKSYRLSDKLNKYFDNNIKLTFVTLDEVIIITKEDLVYKIGINDNCVLLGLGSDDSFIDLSIVENLSFKKIIGLVSGLSCVFAWNSDDEVYCWGSNYCGQLGNGQQEDDYFEPELNENLSHKNIIDIRCCTFHSLALTRSGEVYAWGFNVSGQIGNESFEDVSIPIKINQFDGQQVIAISCGSLHSMALTKKGQVFSWGDNRFGQLGVGNNENYNKPKHIPIEIPIQKISCGYIHNLLLASDGDVYVFGQFINENEMIPIKIKSNKYLDIESHYFTSVGLSKDNYFYVLGSGVENMAFDTFDSAFCFYNNITFRPYHGAIKFKDYFIQNQKYKAEFEEEEKLGSGSFGTVYKVRNKIMDNKSLFAVKLMNKKITEDNLLREFKISSNVAKLDEKFVTRYYNMWFENISVEVNGKRQFTNELSYYIQMEVCDKSLQDIIDEIENDVNLIDSAETTLTLFGYYISSQLFIEVLEGVRYLHNQNPSIIHRDLKPENILIKKMSEKTFVKIADFGLAKIFDLIGQPEAHGEFLAPEVADSKEYTTKADIFSLGMIAQKLLSISTFEVHSFESNSYILKSKYKNAIKMYLNTIHDNPNVRPDCDEILNDQKSWVLNETEEIEDEKFNAKEEFKRIENENNETYIYSILRSKLNYT